MTRRIRTLDTETYLIGPGAVSPKMVCFTSAERIKGRIETFIRSTADHDCAPLLQEMLQVDGHRLVFHNACYDLTVIAKTYPELEPLIWAKLEAGEVTDTKIREQLINLSTSGKLTDLYLPDGSSMKISYKLMDLVKKHLGLDISADKTGDDIWRLRFHELDGIPSAQYPRDASEYAQHDAGLTLEVYEKQEEEAANGGASLATEEFQTASDFALRCITEEGMEVDPVKFQEISEMLARELDIEKMGPLVDAGILTAPEPSRPYANQEKKAIALLHEWTGQTSFSTDDYLWWQPELEGAGIKFKSPEPSKCKTTALKNRVLAALYSDQIGGEVEVLAKNSHEDLLEAAIRDGVKFKKTDTGLVSTDSEVIDDVADLDDVLGVYQHRQALQKLVSTELPRMTWEGKPAPRVHFCYKVLVETGRTSSHADKLFPSGNGQQIDPRARLAFRPTKGVYCSTDYSTLELVCVGQTMLDLFGYSVHADKINAGYDLHAYLGSQLALKFSPWFREMLLAAEGAGQITDAQDADEIYRLFCSFKKSEHADHRAFYGHWRKFAKPIGLGFPGGLGPYKMIGLAKKTYGVDIVGEAVKRFQEHPEEFDPTDKTVLYWAKKLYGMAEDEFEWRDTLKGIALAKSLRTIWLDTYPEMRDYFAMLNDQRPRKKEADNESKFEEGEYSYVTPFGMFRNHCSYTAAANGQAMQSPAAEGFKCAVFNLVRATRDWTQGSILYGRAKVVNEIHDETITHIFDESKAHDCAMAIKEIMEESMRLVIRDVKVKAEPALMRRWDKKAEPVYVDNILVPWEPKPVEVAA